MPQLLKITIWNANGLCQHAQEIRYFLQNNNVDILLISETHFTQKSYVKIPKYKVYHTNHPDGTAHGGTAIIIKTNIKHHQQESYSTESLQATTITIEESVTTLNISAVYSPPKFNLKKEDYSKYFKTLGNRFLAGGDFNAKHQFWGSRITRSEGRQMLAAIQENNMGLLTTGEPTYWPADRRRVPDLLDFCVTKGIDTKLCTIKSSFELAADHSSIIVTLNSEIILTTKNPTLTNKYTNWQTFRHLLDERLNLNIPLKTAEDIDIAVENLSKNIQTAAWQATPELKHSSKRTSCPIILQEKIAEKRKIRKRWQQNRTPENKRQLNKATKELKNLMVQLKNENIQKHLEQLTATERTEYSLWKALKHIKKPRTFLPPIKKPNGDWAKTDQEKAENFAEYLTTVFQPADNEASQDTENEIQQSLETPHQMSLPVRKITIQEVKHAIKHHTNPRKAPGFDLITGKVLQELTDKAFRALTQIFNAVTRTGHFPGNWKISTIIMISKPGKPTDQVTSYRPISLLPLISKVYEKLLLKRLHPILDQETLIPTHQFGFRKQHRTIEQVHRIVNRINNDLESKKYCTATFLDITQAFDKVWHLGLRHKLKKQLPHTMYEILNSYLHQRYFLVKQQDKYTDLFPILSGVPQGSVLGPVLYLLYTSDMPITNQTMIATFADDTAILASHANPTKATCNLQRHLDELQLWLKTWRIKVNESKSAHITFTNRKETCPPVSLNGHNLKQVECVKYLGMHLDRKLTWHRHITAKRKQLGLTYAKLYWMMGRKSQLTTYNKLLVYKTILKPIWTYGIEMWGTTSNSNIEILRRFQTKVLRAIVNAPWYVPNTTIERDLQMPSVRQEIQKCSAKYSKKVLLHPNILINSLAGEPHQTKRLKRFRPLDLPTRF
jgi:hypothetical protein